MMRFPELREALRKRVSIEESIFEASTTGLDPADELWVYLDMALAAALERGCTAPGGLSKPWLIPDWLVHAIWETIVEPDNRDLLEERWSRRRSMNGTAVEVTEAALETMNRIEESWSPPCNCVASRTEPSFHSERQDTKCDAWRRLLDLIEEARADRRELLEPARAMSHRDGRRIVTLPASISQLTHVRKLVLYGSHLVRIPPVIGAMKSLETFDPYTSYRLHWFPYEITRCPNLVRSRVSTRALYGNFKYRPPFPRLAKGWIAPDRALGSGGEAVTTCSVCDHPLGRRMRQVWISLRVATDVLPLLVNACSAECIGRLPAPAEGYVPRPHAGGSGQPYPPRT